MVFLSYISAYTLVFFVLYFPFQALKGMAATFRVTSSQIIKTSAERRLPSTDSVLTLLKWVERHLGRRKPSLEVGGISYRRNSAQLGAIQMEMSMVPSPPNANSSPTVDKTILSN